MIELKTIEEFLKLINSENTKTTYKSALNYYFKGYSKAVFPNTTYVYLAGEKRRIREILV
ncbi:MAG: hypothetical protein QXJ68_01050 [Methanocellales archaeon]